MSMLVPIEVYWVAATLRGLVVVPVHAQAR